MILSAKTRIERYHMHTRQRTQIVQWLLVILGLAMIVIGALGPIAPPIITGVGFFAIAWWMMGNYPKG